MGKIKDFLHFILHWKANILNINGSNNTTIQADNVYESYSIIPMTDFLSTWKSRTDYIQFPNFEQLKNDIIAQDGTIIRFLGLSGLGKSRLIYEIFSSIDSVNNYYCSNASDSRVCNDLQTFLSKNKGVNGFIVFDNCDTQSFISLMSIIQNVISNFKIIAIHNDPSERVSTSGVNVIRLQKSDLKKSVDDFIDNRLNLMSCDDTSVHEQIRNMSDGFPQIAIKAIWEYEKMGRPQLIKDEVLWKKMCGSILDNKDNAIALQAISLFDPLGFEDEVSGDYAYIKHNEDITPLYDMSARHKDSIFQDVVSNLKDSELVEQTASWIVVRPLPLAVWLVGQWFEKCNPERFLRVVNDLENLSDKSMATRITRAFCKRLENMQDNENAVEMFNKLMHDNGPFDNEEVVCSYIGSRLFLAISTVDPVAVTNCLYHIINGKTTRWLKENIKHEARRNLVWCLEHLCFPEETFENGAWILAKLSLAENEKWGNNASGIFDQLFHVELPGTSASLKHRLNIIRRLSESGKEFTPILLGALNRAFDYGSFTRSGGGEKFGLKTLTDFRPTGLEIIEYWNGCKDVVKEVISENKDCIDDIKKIVYDHSYALGTRSGCWDILFELIGDIADANDTPWPEMGERLYSMKVDKNYLSEKDKELLDKWIERLSDHSFVTTLSEASYKFNHEDENRQLDNRVKNAPAFWKLYVDMFIENNLYADDTTVRQLLEFTEIDYVFTKTLAQTLDEEKAKSLSDIIKSILEDENTEFESVFINIFFGELTYKLIFDDFCDYLLQTHHVVQYVVLITPKETKDLKVLDKLLKIVDQKRLPLADTIKIYFARAPLYDVLQMANTYDKIKNNVPNSSALLLYYIIRKRYSGLIFKDPMYENTKSLLLGYTPQDNDYVGFREINRLVEDILRECNDAEFAKLYNKKIIDGIVDFRTFLKYKNLYDGVYFELLPKYQDAILEDVLSALSNLNLAFYLNFRYDLGSGSSMGRGPLFQCNIDKIKAKCIEEREGNLPSNLANMCPVFYYSDEEKHYEDRFSDFFYWLVDNFDEFKKKKEILDSFHSNMGTYSWSGSVIPLLKRKQKAFLTLRKKTNDKMILHWIENSLSLLDKEINRESKNEAYEKLI